MKRLSNYISVAVLCAMVLTWSGCKRSPVIGYYLSSPLDLTRLDRVVFLELGDRDSSPGIARDMTISLTHAIQAKRLFEIDVVNRDDPLCKTVSLDTRGGFTLKQLQDMRKTFKCDGILVGEIRNFRPYPAMQVSLNLRLMDLRNGRCVWAIDNVWDVREQNAEKRIRKFFNKYIRDDYQPSNWRIALMSPKIFGKFVAFESADTLPKEIPSEQTEPEKTENDG